MKAAILISGHMRSFERCLPTLHWHVFRHFTGADFFVSTEPDEDAGKAELLRMKYPSAQVSIDTTPQPGDEVLIPPLHDAANPRPWEHAPYAISVLPGAVVGQLWRLQQCWEWFERTRALDYDLIIRCRPDLWMESLTLPTRTVEVVDTLDNRIRSTSFFAACSPKQARTPWWGRFGGVNDRFAVLGRDAASHYFTTYAKLHQLLDAGCPLHPESLIKASLEDGGCVIDDTLAVMFSTLRPPAEQHPAGFTRMADGSGRRFPEVIPQDFADFARSR